MSSPKHMAQIQNVVARTQLITRQPESISTSRKASAYELISVMMTRTCFSHW